MWLDFVHFDFLLLTAVCVGIANGLGVAGLRMLVERGLLAFVRLGTTTLHLR
jgi:hypothetical protein